MSVLGVGPGGWRDELGHAVARIRSSDDPAYVLAQLADPRDPVRYTAVEWIIAHDAEAMLREPSAGFGRPQGILTDRVAGQLLRDPVVGSLVAAHVTSPAPLVEFLVSDCHDWVTELAAARRILALGGLDELLAAVDDVPQMPIPAGVVLSLSCTREDVLESLLPCSLYHQNLLLNPALTPNQREFLLTQVQPWEVPGSEEAQSMVARAELPLAWIEPDPGAPVDVSGYPLRAPGDPAQSAQTLSGAVEWLSRQGARGGPGGYEAAELRGCGPAGGALLARAEPLCRAALHALFAAHPLPIWGEEATTWAVELASAAMDPSSPARRMGIATGRPTRADLHDIPEAVLRDAAGAARSMGRADQASAELADGVAGMLDSLAAGGGSLPWLRTYGDETGYDDDHAFAILALRTAVPVVLALTRAGG